MTFCPEHPKRDQNPKIYTPKRDDEHPRPFHMGSHPPGFKMQVNIFHVKIVGHYVRGTFPLGHL